MPKNDEPGIDELVDTLEEDDTVKTRETEREGSIRKNVGRFVGNFFIYSCKTGIFTPADMWDELDKKGAPRILIHVGDIYGALYCENTDKIVDVTREEVKIISCTTVWDDVYKRHTTFVWNQLEFKAQLHQPCDINFVNFENSIGRIPSKNLLGYHLRHNDVRIVVHQINNVDDKSQIIPRQVGISIKFDLYELDRPIKSVCYMR